MLITNQNAVKQALANIKLESLAPSEDILKLIQKALNSDSIDTSYILELMRD